MGDKWVAVEDEKRGGWDVLDGQRLVCGMLTEAVAKRIAASAPLPPEKAWPLVHCNGTSADELLELREKAYAAVSEAKEALKQMAPNGRDYYLEDGRMQRAELAHRLRQLRLDAILKELEDECHEIQSQRK